MSFATPLNFVDEKKYSAWLTIIQSHELGNGDSAVKRLVSARYDNEPCSVVGRSSGSFNFCFHIRFHGDRADMLLRFPIQGVVMNALGKVEDEVAVMKLIRAQTSIPIPECYGYGIASGEFEGLGPFILMEFVHGARLDELLCSGDEFRPSITESHLGVVYDQIADMYVQLWRLDFAHIGALTFDETTLSSGVKSEFSTIKLNDLRYHGIEQTVVVSNEPRSDAADYMRALVDQNIQRIWDKSYPLSGEDACRQEYLSLLSLKTITSKMSAEEYNHGPFKLYNPDIRLGNMIADDTYRIKAFIDWEFCYIAPAQFLFSPPLGIGPMDMLQCPDDELCRFKDCLRLFLRVLDDQDKQLSALMSDAMSKGIFWYNQAVQDAEFWPAMLERLWKVVPEPQVRDPPDMTEFIQRKSEHYKERYGHEW